MGDATAERPERGRMGEESGGEGEGGVRDAGRRNGIELLVSFMVLATSI